MPSLVLQLLTLLDAPGILLGENQRTNRGYGFTKVVSWFANQNIHVIAPATPETRYTFDAIYEGATFIVVIPDRCVIK